MRGVGVIEKSNIAAAKALGKKITAARKSKRFSKPALAKAIGVTHVQIGLYEEGKNSPTKENLEKLAKVLDVSPEYLLIGPTKQSHASFSVDKWMREVKELSEGDQLKVAEYIQLLSMKARGR
jgi:transcriptional regulator with XRE-family HTH domain